MTALFAEMLEYTGFTLGDVSVQAHFDIWLPENAKCLFLIDYSWTGN